MYDISLDKLMKYIDENFDELAKSVTKSSGFYEPNSADSLLERGLLVQSDCSVHLRDYLKEECSHDSWKANLFTL